jgi:serine/threonine-protein kinase
VSSDTPFPAAEAGASVEPAPVGSTEALLSAETIGPYRIERLLGRGGMGVVLEAYDERLDRRVALKRVLDKDGDPRRRERLRREARAAAGLAHPGIVRIFDLFEEDGGGDWIVMELVEGARLADLLRAGPLETDRVLDYGRQIASGLAAAHDRGIVHRDLKAENVMVLPDGEVKILDFGLAKRLDPGGGRNDDSTLSAPGQVLGTGRAMAPEQARGLGVGPRSDLFSLGVLFYEMLTGTSPFRSATLYDTLVRVSTHRPPSVVELVEDVPEELSELVDRLLRKAPELRPASAREVAGLLGRLAEERRLRARGRAVDAPRDTGAETVTVDGVSPVSRNSLGDSDTRHRETPEPSARSTWLRWVLVPAGLVLATVLGVRGPAVFRGPEPEPEAGAADRGAARADPLALYEEGMRAVRRTDRPDGVERAVAIFQRLLEDDGESAAAHAGLARADWEKARNASLGGDPIFLEQAAAVAREAVRLDPFLADARVSLGLVRLSQGDSAGARQELDAALELDPTSADACYGLAELAKAEDEPEAAERHLRRALELDPEPLYSDVLGGLLYAQGRLDEAEASFRASLELAPDDAHALRSLGGLYYAQDRLDEAAAFLQAALKIRPHASAYSNLGTIFFGRGLYARAAEAFENALSTAGATHNPIFWINLADAYRQLPDKEPEARATYRRAIQLLGEQLEAAPGDVRARTRRALAAARSGGCPAALDDLAALGETAGSDVYSRFRQAVTEELCGQREQALATLEEALRSGLGLSEVEREPDLLALRADVRFHRLLMTLSATS